jgi:hypothetical protein
MKNHLPHEVPLSAAAQACLLYRKEEIMFSGSSKIRIFRLVESQRLDKAIGFDNWGLHDFQRTLSTRLNDAGAHFEV